MSPDRSDTQSTLLVRAAGRVGKAWLHGIS